MIDSILIDLQQYKTVCKACDKILDAASDVDEVVSIPMLHVVREHPQCLKLYNFIFNEEKNFKSRSVNLLKKALGLTKSILFDSKINNIPFNFDKDSRNLIIVSHITNPNQCSNIDDEYFGSLHNNLLKFSNIRPIILLINQTSVSSKQLSKDLTKNKIDRIVIPKSSGLLNELIIFFRLLAAVYRFTRSKIFRDPVASSILNILSKPSIFLSGMSALRIGFFVEKIVKISDSKYIFTTYEGHSRERIIFSSARKANKDILCYAYQHTVLNKYQHSLTRNIHKKYNPDHIFCCGAITHSILSGCNSLNGVETSILGSPKGSLGDLHSKKIDNNKNLTFLFLPEGIESEYEIFFNFILECANVFPKSRFVWRSHPLLDLEELDFFKEKILPANITISKNKFDDDLKLPDIAVYRGTNAIIRAVMGNLIPIYLKIKGEIGIDIMSVLELNRVLSISELRSIMNNPHLLLNKKETVKFCQDYFRPMNYKSFLQVVNQNGS